ncbi:5-dehydro-4-deoxy-D-glucuronate isomerase [Pontibacter qinzhouensis]|uniref:4-deoxy-L-threo-5-hexosulose-uronate ketol-isomerase n=1 Tax=Pontibacter qinzhouensis TaxID=2603253 RepID=A0A5C8K7R2_9BACT|nr:5-dehydro-4-deoxy-D-glucuronate isomerase [Pontibacter qinzhouensis]TXK47445.1 5-dehydro-4-deoxy-D-glucuronate isomerase [Pontibacter qinzhouensis]
MSMQYDVRYAVSPQETKQMDTEALRKNFLIETVFAADQIQLTYTHYDRYMAGGAMPVSKSVKLETIDPLKAEFFLERREMGIINVGGAGTVEADGQTFELQNKEALYLGRGTKDVTFSSADGQNPAKFYINSAPAHHAYPSKKVTRKQAEVVELGTLETANARTITKLLIAGVIETCQLQMGMTELKTGSVWNTMPAHSHDRRMEVYLYFDVPAEQSVCHFMGEPTETRHIWMQNEQAVISPPWSVHSGSGTSNYTFIWGMAGENLDYGDMDIRKITELR